MFNATYPQDKYILHLVNSKSSLFTYSNESLFNTVIDSNFVLTRLHLLEKYMIWIEDMCISSIKYDLKMAILFFIFRHHVPSAFDKWDTHARYTIGTLHMSILLYRKCINYLCRLDIFWNVSCLYTFQRKSSNPTLYIDEGRYECIIQ